MCWSECRSSWGGDEANSRVSSRPAVTPEAPGQRDRRGFGWSLWFLFVAALGAVPIGIGAAAVLGMLVGFALDGPEGALVLAYFLLGGGVFIWWPLSILVSVLGLPFLFFRRWIAAPDPPYLRRGFLAVAIAAFLSPALVGLDPPLGSGAAAIPLALILCAVPGQVTAYFTVRFFARMASRTDLEF